MMSSATRSSPSPKRPRVEPAGAAARPEKYIVFLGGVSQKATPAAIEQALWRRVRGFAGGSKNYRLLVPDLTADVNTDKCAVTVKADQIKVKLSKLEKGNEWLKLSKGGKY